MDARYQMLGREHELDLEREAQRRHLGAVARRTKASRAPAGAGLRWLAAVSRRLVQLREAALLSRRRPTPERP